MIEHPAVYRPAVYRLFDADDRLLYIGQTGGDLTGRLRQHMNKPWGPLIARREIEWHDTREGAISAEALAIKQENPIHNVVRRHPAAAEPVAQTTDTPRLAGAQEISYMLGVNRQRVNQFSALPEFPAPLAVLAMGKVWAAADIEKWARRVGREVHPR